MTWVRLDDDFYNHPKVILAGPLGIAMQVAGLCYCSKHNSQGFVPADVVPSLLDLSRVSLSCDEVVNMLLDSGLWQKTSGGYAIDLSFCRITFGDSVRQVWNAIRKWAGPLVIKRDGAICKKCGSTDDLTIDHIVPVSRGGTNDMGNLQVLCRSCNSKKSSKLLQDMA